LSEEPDFEILETRLLSNPEAYGLLKKAVDKILEKEPSVIHLVQKTLDYLKKFSKMDPESATAVRGLLEKYGLKEETIVMIINICPKTVDELRSLLELEERFIETETAEEIVGTLKNYCRE